MTSLYKKLISKFKNKKILVVGDLILDEYILGTVSRISPEAPVPVVFQEESFYRPGGGANVATNLKSLGAEVFLVGRRGADLEGKILLRELTRRRLSTQGIWVDPDSPTSLKTRIIAQHQQVVRVDREHNRDMKSSLNQKLISFLGNIIPSVDALILSDYGKGTINPELIGKVSFLAHQHNKVIIIDPKVEHFSYYRGVTAITPNKKEAENAIRNIKISDRQGTALAIQTDRLNTNGEINRAGLELVKYLDLECLLLTLGQQGMKLFERGKPPVNIPTTAQEIYDVSGAGDTVVAVFTLALTAGASKRQAAELANRAAGVVVGKLGTVAITKTELQEAL